MAIMATQTANSSKKAESRESHDERDAAHKPGARPGEAGKTASDSGGHKPPSAEPDSLDSVLDDPYDNVACTD